MLAVCCAFAIAAERWPASGMPANPGAWLVTTARNRAIDYLRSAGGRERNAVEYEETDHPALYRDMGDYRRAEPLCKNPPWAAGCGAAKSANRDPQLNSPTMRWQVEEPPLAEVGVNQVARCWVLMRNVKEEDIEAAKASALSRDAAQKLKAPAPEVGSGGR